MALTPRQIRYLKHRIDGKTKVESKRLAGYDESTSTEIVERSKELKSELAKALDRQGLSTDMLAKKIAKGTEAKKKHYYAFEGKVMDEREVEDNETQFKYTKLACEVRGDLVQEGNQLNVNVGLVEIPRMAKDAEAWNAETEQINAQSSANDEKAA